MAATGFFSALAAGAVIMVIGLVCHTPLCRLLGATDTILPYALDYMCIILMAAPWITAALVLNNQLRLQGNATYAMVGLVSGGVLNIALDPLFIFVFDMGIAGAAVATILSQFISFCLLLLGRPAVGRHPDPAAPVLPQPQALSRAGGRAACPACAGRGWRPSRSPA